MLAAANRFPDNRSKNPADFQRTADELRRRKAQRQKLEQTKGWLQRNESIQIIKKVSAQFTTRKISEEINIGPDVGVHPKTGSFRGRPTLKITVGHMWYRRVWQNLYQDSRFPTPMTTSYCRPSNTRSTCQVSACGRQRSGRSRKENTRRIHRTIDVRQDALCVQARCAGSHHRSQETDPHGSQTKELKENSND